MDPLTHALSGVLLARAAATASARLPLRWQITAGFAAAAFPDIDLILRLIEHEVPSYGLVHLLDLRQRSKR